MLTLEEMKLHCRVDGDEDDVLLEAYGEAAMEVVKMQTSRNWYERPDEIPEDDPSGMAENPAIRQAMLLLVGHWYKNREAVGDETKELPLGFWALIQPYRIYHDVNGG